MDSAPTDQAYSGYGTDSLFMPGRVDICLPGRANQVLPIPLDRVYNVEERRLVSDCFDFLNYAVQLILDIASHLSPSERERLAQSKSKCVFVHPTSGLLLHTERSFAHFGMKCILAEHNSTEALVLSPSWPSVYFDQDGYPAFCDQDDNQYDYNAGVIAASSTTSLAGEKISAAAPHLIEHTELNRERYPGGSASKPAPGDWGPVLVHVPNARPKKRRHFSQEKQQEEYTTMMMPRL